ncbi:MAG: MOFRL family protein, partial [Deltaproteobacteria bacterium]
LGFAAHIMTSVLEGEAESVAAFLYAIGREISHFHTPFQPPVVLLFGGETTVKVTGSGRGGRNQQLALAALCRIGRDARLTLLTAGTDGIDGNSHAAGAIADADGFLAAVAKGLEPGRYLKENDATAFFERIDSLVVTGPTGTNVMDIMVLLVTAKGEV